MPRIVVAIAVALPVCWMLAGHEPIEPPVAEQSPVTHPVPTHATPEPAAQIALLRAADVPTEAVHDRLAVLDAGSTLTLPDPEGGELSLTVASVRRSGGFTFIALESDGLSSQVTLRGDRYMATIATRRGSYQVRDLDDPSTWVTQRSLNQRADPHAEDYRLAPVG